MCRVGEHRLLLSPSRNHDSEIETYYRAWRSNRGVFGRAFGRSKLCKKWLSLLGLLHWEDFNDGESYKDKDCCGGLVLHV
jgi:hypothetical protein